MNNITSDKRHHRIVTLVSLVLALAIYFLSVSGLFGERMERFAPYYLAIILTGFALRAILTELGIRRRRLSFERQLSKPGKEG